MSLFRRHNRIRGIRVWKWKTFQIEVWFCPKDERIEAHIHHRIDSKITLLCGRMLGSIAGRGEGMVTRWKGYPIPAGVAHAAVMKTFCVFINAERWAGPSWEVSSAAEDFTAV